MRPFHIKETTAQPCVELLCDAGRAVARCITLAAVAGAGSLLFWQSRGWICPAAGNVPAGQLIAEVSVDDPTGWTDAFAAGTPIDAQDASGYTALAQAARRGDVDLAARLIDGGADIAAVSEIGMTPLAMAAMNGRIEMIRVLIEAGAAVDQPIRRDGTALHAAASQSQHEAAKLLIAHGADVNRRDCEGCTPLMRLAYVGEANPALAATLIAAGADLRLRNDEGQTAYEIAEAEGDGDLIALLR